MTASSATDRSIGRWAKVPIGRSLRVINTSLEEEYLVTAKRKLLEIYNASKGSRRSIPYQHKQ
uniref:Uncharacterized protein n=1 Tax=Romanomermis culicivorax TaxID=13658 RepID=A0A915IME2_ROMCU